VVKSPLVRSLQWDKRINLTNQNNCVNLNKIDVSKAQLNFINFCKEFGWGEIKVVVRNGEPVMVSPIKQDFKMTEL